MLQVFTLEMRKIFSYRIDFWTQFIAYIVVWVGVSYFLWSSIFAQKGVNSIGDYSFHALMLYYLITASVAKIIRGEDIGQISREIYQGELSRYLVYPIPFFLYKFICHLAHSFMYFIQLICAIVFFVIVFGLPSEIIITQENILLCIVFLLLSCYLHFSIAAVVEIISFWADNVWSLLVMLRFISGLLGGALLPLVLFPEWAQEILYMLPFPYLISFSSEIFMNKVTYTQTYLAVFIVFAWSVFFNIIFAVFWKKGLRQYSGVGI